MENLKIRVNSEAESKQAQGLLEKLGFKKFVWGKYSDYFIFANSNYYSRDDISNFSECDYKEITLPELRDLVILKRNDIEDATHESPCGELKFILLGDWWNLFTGGKWQQFSHKQSPRCNKLKPIEKPMKEYLRKNSNGTYSYIGMVQPENISQNVIEIPDGAETFNFYDRKDNLFFLKGTGENALFSNDLNDWEWKHWGNIDFDGVVCLWSRHTHPEELPFIDDEPSLNDQYAGIEKVRQTLNQRQSQYGSFEDVAMITEQMVDIMRKGYYENLAYNQKMALYMICSKMARIVNGNPNHKDSWHDIAGYATLIDNELVSEKDMPF